ncbi:AAA family ATPase [Pseudomonas tremae]|uniref:ATP-binding protein n=1 Tax=Pseudomonas syringae group TaxID=136849 RepID=UPI0001AF535A|nr:MULTISPECIES: ATP-binding protein [Pseudomonas syringae group]MCQ3014359.1 AAA family ATPase [Pseudomonas tremae]QGL57080.1 hypothetical protein POR16_12315 [Pseudomonas coronafaciens pv. oryzae str. 1_6]RMM30869.1 hypothetical protein ALQ80_04108 [Pseudomonas coronafaciens pv. oryzae]
MSDTTNTSFGDLFSTGQIRLAEISAYNWGSFHGLHTAVIDPEGTLITGDNGAGKSTLIDAHMALLNRPGQTSFNIAASQGDRSDRNLMSYIRGNYGTAHDGSQTLNLMKRDGATMTALRALYRADDGSEITLVSMFWIRQAGASMTDLKRFYLVGKRNVSLEVLLQQFGSNNVRQLKQYVDDDPMLKHFDNSFSAYQEYFTRLLRMENSNAPALLQRALGLKKIDDLTALIRELVLEPSKVRDLATGVVKEFDDLIAVHNELDTAKQQKEVLSILPDHNRNYESSLEEQGQVNSEATGLTAFFGEQGNRLWGMRCEDLDRSLDDLTSDGKRLAESVSRNEERVTSLLHAYQQQGGDRLDSLRREVEDAERGFQTTTNKAHDYQKDTRDLGLAETLTASAVRDNIASAKAVLVDLPAQIDDAKNAFGESRGALSGITQQIKNLQAQISEIEKRPNSNIDAAFQRLRDEMVESLQLNKDGVVFIGELLDVRSTEARWRGAIERALGGHRTTLLVPEDKFRMVTGWVNSRHTGLHVRVQVVSNTERNPEFLGDGFLRKLEWKEHPYRDWLKRHLARFDLHCVDSTEVLNDTPYSMTREGLVHMEKGRFEKKDGTRVDDKKNWYLGFNNLSRLAALQEEGERLREGLDSARSDESVKRQEMDILLASEAIWKRVAQTLWDQIDVTLAKQHLDTLKNDLAAINAPDSDLSKAKALLELAKKELQEIRNAQNQNARAVGGLELEIQQANKSRQVSALAASAGLADAVRQSLSLRVGILTLEHLDKLNQLEKTQREFLDDALNSIGKRANHYNGRMIAIINSFKTKWPLVANDWLTTIEGRQDYIDYLDKLNNEGLPDLVERFQQRLNNNTTQSLGRMQRAIDDEREDIRDRIATINEVLERTEFNHGTFLRLKHEDEHYAHVKEFTALLGSVLKHASSVDHESRFLELCSLISKLEKATNSATAINLESQRLLDSRYRMTFYANEIVKETGAVRDVLRSSSGKSGGEKESFAGIIVAASLAYVLTPDGAPHPMYCTVFLDEAFSNTADKVSRRVLRVFRELKIHVNLITPYKNLNLARDSARSLIIAERKIDGHESRLSQITWDQLDQQSAERREAKQTQLAGVAEGLGIQMEQL